MKKCKLLPLIICSTINGILERDKQMTNYEKYKDDIEKLILDGHSIAFDNRSNNLVGCNSISCLECKFNDVGCNNKRKEWLNAEYEEPEIDWTKVPKGTHVWVRDFEYEGWLPELFFGVDNKGFVTSVCDLWVATKVKEGGTHWKECKLDDEVDPTPYYKEN